MIGIAPLLALFLTGLIATPAGAQPPVRAQAVKPWPTLFSDKDYPADAVRNYEQGPVAFRLEIGAEGTPTDCVVVGSSGSFSLDATTCRLMMERARFRPARDAQGKATTDDYLGRIVWKLPGVVSRPAFAFTLWRGCVLGEAAKYVLSGLPTDEIARRSFPPCAGLETLYARESGQTAPLAEPRDRVRALLEDLLLEGGKILKTRTANKAGQPK